jgi:hypothetical protein
MDKAPKRAGVADCMHGWTVTRCKIRPHARLAKTHEQHRTL